MDENMWVEQKMYDVIADKSEVTTKNGIENSVFCHARFIYSNSGVTAY